MSDYDHDQYSLKEVNANTNTQLDITIQEIVSSLNELIYQVMTMSENIKTLEAKIEQNEIN